MAGGQSASASWAPEEGASGAREEGIAGQTIPVHDGRAAEPLSALRYVRSTSLSPRLPEGSVPCAAESMMRFSG